MCYCIKFGKYSQTPTIPPSKCFLPGCCFFFFLNDVYIQICTRILKIKDTLEYSLFLHSTHNIIISPSLNAKTWIWKTIYTHGLENEYNSFKCVPTAEYLGCFQVFTITKTNSINILINKSSSHLWLLHVSKFLEVKLLEQRV